MPSHTPLLIKAAALLTPAARLEEAYLRVADGRITGLGQLRDLEQESGEAVLDASRETLAPGFIDVHIHGGAGIDVMDCSFEDFDRLSRSLAQHGTTAFLPTTITAPARTLAESLRRLARYHRKPLSGAAALGIHMEGPFISREYPGTHPAEHILEPSGALLSQWLEACGGTLRWMTLAPEGTGCLDLIRSAAGHGVVVSMGHSNADEKASLAAVESGVRHATHVFNAMRPFRHRDPGILGVALTDDRVSGEVIADGVHAHPAAVRLLWRSKPAGQFVLVTDATSATGMPDGAYRLGDRRITVRDGVCRDAQGVLAGSTLTLDRAVRQLRQWVGCSLAQAVTAASLNPARLLGIDPERGCLRPGATADVVFLDEREQVTRTMVGGRMLEFP